MMSSLIKEKQDKDYVYTHDKSFFLFCFANIDNFLRIKQ